MNKILLLKQTVYAGTLAIVCLHPNKLLASCNPTIAKNPPTVTGSNYPGNSQTDSFRCAINGGKDLTMAQLRERSALIPEKVSDRFYLRFGLNASSEGIVGVKNLSTSTATSAGTVETKQFNVSSNNIELALGYTWTDFAIDLEWLALKSINYDSTLTGITPNVSFTTITKGDALLGNFYWNFKNLYNFNFYAVALIGTTGNKTTTTITNGTANIVNKKYAISFGGGIGAKFNIISSVYADMSARYINLGKTKFEASNAANTSSILLKGTRRWIGMSVRLLWLL